MWYRSSCRGAACVATVALLLAAGTSAGQVFADREQARVVLEQAEREARQIEAEYLRASRECEQSFFANACLERARRQRDQRKRDVREGEVAARDALRRFDAAERARARAERSAQIPPANDKAGKHAMPGWRNDGAVTGSTPHAVPVAPSGQPPGSALPEKQADAEQRRVDNERRAAAHAAERQRHAAETAAKAAASAERIERYEQRQREAKARQEEKARIAEQNAQRRERRRQERERAAEALHKAASE